MAYAFKDKLNGIFLSTNQEVYRTIDGCKTLIKVSKPQVYCTSIDYAKAKSGKKDFYIAGTTIGNGGGSFYTKDDGNSWGDVGDLYSYASVDFFDANTGIASSAGANNKIQFFDGLTGIEEKSNLAENKIIIFPNPVTTYLSIKSNENLTYFISDSKGEIICQGKILNNENIDVSTFNCGVYFISFFNDGIYFNSKFIKLNLN